KQNIAFALERTVTVMVITCPHALGLAVPLVVAVSTAISAKHGLLIRDRIAFENARKIQAIIFDKTGTLTKGEFGVTDIIIFNENMDEDTLITYAASIETNSEHPIAKGITKQAKKILPVFKFKAIPGKGAEGKVDGKKVMVVSPRYLKEHEYKIHDEKISKVISEGKTVVFVIIDDHVSGAIALSDIIRPESKETVESLKKMGIKSIMLTGDSEKVAKWVAKEIGISEYFAEVLPGEKANKVKEIQSRGLTVAMTGDGVNDAPALTQADIGIAIGAGTEIAIQSADIILVKSNPKNVVTLIKLAKATYKKMVQNLAWATGYNLIAIPLAAGVAYQYGILLSPAVGALLMSLSTVIVAINAKLLRLNN
ncbi:MAG TPA: heavy metal translocating P-type ATPase, partial [Candidatus Atribacteria bacterium]|nr:heavy metal translocating P-type ATPase [Candidatus Atribacteria bacterium]